MDIRIESLLEGAKRATGAIAVIDVLRAFTTAAVAFANGATHIVMVASVDEAIALRAQGVADFCMGETHGRMPPGFNFGNSPFEMSNADLRGKALLQRTSAGTQGMVAAGARARYLFAAALVTATATAMRSGFATRANRIWIPANWISRCGRRSRMASRWSDIPEQRDLGTDTRRGTPEQSTQRGVFCQHRRRFPLTERGHI